MYSVNEDIGHLLHALKGYWRAHRKMEGLQACIGRMETVGCLAGISLSDVDFIKKSEVAERQLKGLQKGLNRLRP